MDLYKVYEDMHQPVEVAIFSQLPEKLPQYALVENTDLVVIRYGDELSVLYGRCLHRGALLSDGRIEGDNLICGLHNWDYRFDTGVSAYNPSEILEKFPAAIQNDKVFIDKADIIAFEEKVPSRFNRKEYLGLYADTHTEDTEPYTLYIKELAQHGLKNWGHHGPTAAMGVDRNTLPKWDSIQFLPAQVAQRPLLDHEEVSTSVVIGPNAKKPLELKIPLFVSDMSLAPFPGKRKLRCPKGQSYQEQVSAQVKEACYQKSKQIIADIFMSLLPQSLDSPGIK